MRLTVRSRYTALSLALIIALQVACGGGTLLKSFRIALASSPPLVNSLVNAGVIPQAKATAIIADFNDGAQCGLVLQDAFAAIPKELPAGEIKSRKLQASFDGLQCFRTIVQRQNFASNPRIQTVANIAEGILSSLVMFYSDGTARSVATAESVAVAPDEKTLEKMLKVKVKELEAAMRVD